MMGAVVLREENRKVFSSLVCLTARRAGCVTGRALRPFILTLDAGGFPCRPLAAGHKSVLQKRAASSVPELFKGAWGRCPQQAESGGFPKGKSAAFACVY